MKNNENLTKLWIKSCELGTEGARELGNCNKSLKHIFLSDIHFEAGHVSQIVLALSVHPQLKELRLPRMNIGQNECTALSTLLRITTKQLQTLWLSNNNIDDEGVETLVHAISGSKLQVLSLDRNPTITSRGRTTLSTLLERPDSNLKKIYLSRNNLGNDGALVFVNALRNNSKLKRLGLIGNGINSDGWEAFSSLLCDTYSVNNTFLSNHTIEGFDIMDRYLPADLVSSLALNASSGIRDKLQ